MKILQMVYHDNKGMRIVMREKNNNEIGHTIVEATIIYPITIMLFFVLLYGALFVCQSANLQASLEDALVYYKNVGSDTYVKVGDTLSFETDGNTIHEYGGQYGTTKKLDPYRHIFSTFTRDTINGTDFKNFFLSSYKHMFFSDGSNIDVTIKEEDYLIYKRVTATATQKVEAPINIAMVGADNSLNITANASVVVMDGDSMIRDVDFAKDAISQTKLGKKVKELVGKAKDLYVKMKDKLGV